MTQPFKFRYVNEIAGAFVLLCVGLFVVGVILIGSAQGWFESYRTLQISFPAEGSAGLEKGAEVQMLGTVVGSVDKISLTDSGDMQARLSIRSEFFRHIRLDSQILIRRKFFVAGDAYVEITRGGGAPLPPEGHTFHCRAGRDLIETLQSLADEMLDSGVLDNLREVSLGELRESLLAVLDQVRETLDVYREIGIEMKDPEGRLQQLLARLDRITARLESGEGTAGRILNDPTLADQLIKITDKADNSLDDVQSILNDVKKMAAEMPDMSAAREILDLLQAILQDVKAVTAHLPAMTVTLQDELHDAPGMVLQIRDNLREAEELVESLKKHWLIKGYVEEEQNPQRRIPVVDVAAPYDEESLSGGHSPEAEGGGDK